MEEKINKKKLDPQVIKDLQCDEEKIILKAVHKLRSKGNLHYIPGLLKLLSKTDKGNVQKELVLFLADIKESDVRPYMIAGLMDPELKRARGSIVSACWQSGLDYSDKIDLFISIFLEEDYVTALESLTVIEESIENMNEQNMEKARKQVLSELEQVSDQKRPLALELVKLFQV